jgi:hypothetical protein
MKGLIEADEAAADMRSAHLTSPRMLDHPS